MLGLTAFITGCLVSFLGAVLIILSPRLRQLSSITPSEDRWHSRATPGLGGGAMFVAFVTAAWLTGASSDVHAFAILAGASLLCVVGVVDDLRGLGVGLKFSAQLLAACVVVFSNFNVMEITTEWYHPFLGALWIVAIANGVNLVDNMDGLAGGIVLIAVFATLLALSDGGDEVQPVWLLLWGLAGALVGFLALNINPARLFMGDSGSQWLGLVIAACSLLPMNTTTGSVVVSPLVWLVPVLILAVPIIDTTFVMVTRIQRRQPVSQGGKDHLSHRLVRLGFSERVSVAALWLLSLGGAFVAHALIQVGAHIWVPLLILYGCMIAFLLWRLVSQSPPSSEQE